MNIFLELILFVLVAILFWRYEKRLDHIEKIMNDSDLEDQITEMIDLINNKILEEDNGNN